MKTFEEFDLIAPVQRALADQNYETPTPIQLQTVPAALRGRDVLGCAQTGTGKTAAFAVPILNRLGQQNRMATPKRPYALVLAPTRELAIQIGDSCSTYGRHLQLRHALVYGGVSQHLQVRSLQRGAHILVATPGRLLDLMNQGHVQLDQLEVFVLDEVDRMLDMGFLPDLKRIIRCLPKKRQSLFFSATLPPEITQLTKGLLNNPVHIHIAPESKSVAKIQQHVLFVERVGKQVLLRQVLSAVGVDRTIVFTNTKRGANNIAEKLVRSGIRANAIHGNKSQSARQRALIEFRSNHIQVLVATDVAARGIDVDGVTHVVNFDLPVDPESYIHRIGRTGRAGAAGVALSFCSNAERRELRAIEKLIGKKVPLAAHQPPTDQAPPAAAKHRNASTLPSQPNSRPRRRTGLGTATVEPSRPRCSTAVTGDKDKPRRRRRPRKGRQARLRAKQSG